MQSTKKNIINKSSRASKSNRVHALPSTSKHVFINSNNLVQNALCLLWSFVNFYLQSPLLNVDQFWAFKISLKKLILTINIISIKISGNSRHWQQKVAQILVDFLQCESQHLMYSSLIASNIMCLIWIKW